MVERRLRWAREATGGVRHAPKDLILQTQFWAPERPELNLKEAKVVSLLGFNVVGSMRDEVRETVAHESDVEDEMRYLIELISS